MPLSTKVANFLTSLPVAELVDLWAHRECDICQESFFKWTEKPLRLPCGHIFGSKCIAEWLWPTAADLHPKNTCPVCREVIFSNYDRPSWEGASHLPGTRLPVPLLTSLACVNRQAALDHPLLLSRVVEAENWISAGTQGAVGPAAEALALLRVINTEILGKDTGREAADSIPVAVIEHAMHALAVQVGRLYGYYESGTKTRMPWPSGVSEVLTMQSAVWIRWNEWQLQRLVYMERNGARASLPLC